MNNHHEIVSRSWLAKRLPPIHDYPIYCFITSKRETSRKDFQAQWILQPLRQPQSTKDSINKCISMTRECLAQILFRATYGDYNEGTVQYGPIAIHFRNALFLLIRGKTRLVGGGRGLSFEGRWFRRTVNRYWKCRRQQFEEHEKRRATEEIRQNQRAVQQPGAQRWGFFVFSLVAVLANDFYKRIVSQYSPPDAE